jgi:acid phosphatase type 7
VGSAQEQWLRADLAASTKPCTIAYWHHPRFTSGANHSPDTSMGPIVQALYDFDADVVVAGHNHNYERFAPMNPSGQLDTAQGIRHFVAGMGGRSHYNFGNIQPNSEARNSDTFGVLKLTLHTNSYDWQFVPQAGMTYTDSGTTNCH